MMKKTVSEAYKNERHQLLHRLIRALRAKLIKAYKNELYRLEGASVENCAPLVITFCGRFKTGKSSLINALLGENILPTRATTATAVITRITYGKEKNAYIKTDGGLCQVSFAMAYDHIMFRRGETPGEVSEIRFELPLKWLKDIVVVDTPGMDDYPELEALSMNELEKTDIAVVVCDAASLLGQHEKLLAKELDKKLGGNVAFVINRINLLNTEEELREVNRLAKELLNGLGNKPFGRGVVYSLCSAEGNIAFNGFDIWLKNKLRLDPYQFKAIRHFAIIAERLEKLEARLDFDVSLLKAEISALETMAQKERAEKEKRHHAYVSDLKNRLFAAYMRSSSLICGGECEALSAALLSLKYSSDNEYRNKSKEVIKNHARDIMGDAEDFFVRELKDSKFNIKIPYSSVNKVLDDIEVPARKYLSLPRGIADVLLFRHPKTDISAENTKAFFLSAVVTPLDSLLREAYDSLIKEIDASKPDLTSSYQGALKDCNSVLYDMEELRYRINSLAGIKKQSLERLTHAQPKPKGIVTKIKEWIKNIV